MQIWMPGYPAGIEVSLARRLYSPRAQTLDALESALKGRPGTICSLTPRQVPVDFLAIRETL
jgi:hypothetical protein